MKALLALVLMLGVTPALAQPPAPTSPPVTAGHTSGGASFSIPSGWSQRAFSSVIVLDPPESDARLAIVDVAQAQDARAAVVSAWKLIVAGKATLSSC